IVDLAMGLANVCTILVKIRSRLPFTEGTKIFGHPDVGISEIMAVKDDILAVDLAVTHAHALLHSKVAKRDLAAIAHFSRSRQAASAAVARSSGAHAASSHARSVSLIAGASFSNTAA